MSDRDDRGCSWHLLHLHGQVQPLGSEREEQKVSPFLSSMSALLIFLLAAAFKISQLEPRSCEVRHNVTCLRWTSSPKLRSSRPRGSVEAPPPHERGPPSSSRGRPVSSRASRQRRECRGELRLARCSLQSQTSVIHSHCLWPLLFVIPLADLVMTFLEWRA